MKTRTCPRCGEALVILSRSKELRCPRGDELPVREYVALGAKIDDRTVVQKSAREIIAEWNKIGR